MDLAKLRNSLIEKSYDKEKVGRFIAYLSSEKDKKDTPINKHTQAELYNLFVKYHNAGTSIDGINVVITGKNMALITYNGYKNKVLDTYPETEFDIQLMREGDEFNISKDSGKVFYNHKIANPFEDKPIIGAYVVFKNRRGQFFESLNQADFEKMKNSSRNSATWNKWESEFWLKSVLKRASKRHFADVVAKLEEIDNTDYGLEDEKADEDTQNEILKAHGVEGEK